MRVLKVLLGLVLFGVTCTLVAAGGVFYAFHHFGQDLPDYTELASYEPKVTTRVHAGDGRLLAEFAVEKRIFVPVEAIPQQVINAFLSAEDKAFYEHPGVNVMSIARAMVTNVQNIGKGRRLIGASTITQQVAKNFLLTNEVSWRRKIKEAILALRIERAYTKAHILELYLNEIYLGGGAYGAAAASLNYFNKSLDEITISEAAYLAALPKAPNNYHPVRRYDAAVARRNWVIGRMQEDGHITAEEAEEAQAQPLQTYDRDEEDFVTAEYFAEEVRREIAAAFGEASLYQGGLSVRTTVQPRLQAYADEALRSGLIAYDRRHGFRGPVSKLESMSGWRIGLASVEVPKGSEAWELAVVIEVTGKAARIGFADETAPIGVIPLEELEWAKEPRKGQKVGPAPKRADQVLSVGDVILVEALPVEEGKEPPAVPVYGLRQLPEIDGALVAMDPHTGRVLAMSGGFSFQRSQFNRAVQAQRQPGSSFKPFVYLAALDEGMTPTTIVHDEPFVIDQGPGLPKWRPANYSDRFYGASTMRLGIEKSRNLMTVRIAQKIGMERVADVARRFGIDDNLQPTLAMSLGAGETTLLKMTTAYAQLVNGGRKVTPTFIDRVQDRTGRTVYRHDERVCGGCNAQSWEGQAVPAIPDNRPQVGDPASIYQIVSMLEGVVQRGTGRRIAKVGKPLAGKTGTTNRSQDTWFVGFSPDLAVGVFIGFDTPKGLGPKETGSSVPAPVFRDFMAKALADQPGIPFRVPPGIRLVRVDAKTGRPALPGDNNVILEAFRPGNQPTDQNVVEGIGSFGGQVQEGWAGNAVETPALQGTGGLY
ncbi:MAG: penicillin-binding protein 1A [Magnetovibrionaceae bacterium]